MVEGEKLIYPEGNLKDFKSLIVNVNNKKLGQGVDGKHFSKTKKQSCLFGVRLS